MINLHCALNNDRLLRALTGLNRQAFDELRTYAVGGFLASAAREKSPEIQTIQRKCVSPD